MALKFRFDPQKALEAILYISSRAGTDKYGTLKAMYAADKLHLQRYGRTITGDYYHALEQGATPMLTYDIIQYAAGEKPRCQATGVRDALSVGTEDDPHALIPKRDPDLMEFSESDVECLDEVIARAADVPRASKYKVYRDDAHDRAWEEARARQDNSLMEIEAIVRQFPESEQLLEYLYRA